MRSGHSSIRKRSSRVVPVGRRYYAPPQAQSISAPVKVLGIVVLGLFFLGVGGVLASKSRGGRAAPPQVKAEPQVLAPENLPNMGPAMLDMVVPVVSDDTPPPAAEPAPTPEPVANVDPPPTPTTERKPDPEPDPEPAPKMPAPSPIERPKVVSQLPPGLASAALTARIDQELDKALAQANIPASPLADDAQFIRRAFLDITGVIPTYERTVAFVNSTDPYKRSKLIDELLASSNYGRHFAMIWTDMLVKRDIDTNKDLKSAPFITWLSGQFNKNVSWAKIASDMMIARGKEGDSPETFFILCNQENGQPSPAKLVGATGNLFMGIKIECAECHVHPFTTKWTPRDFWGMAAFFGKTRASREGGSKNTPGTATVVEVESNKQVAGFDKKAGVPEVPAGPFIGIPDPTNPKKTLKTVRVKIWEGREPVLPAKGPYRQNVASWVASKEDRYFAPAMVNRMWAHFFARGFVNPIEDMNDDNRPSHPELLSFLSTKFADSRFDLKNLIRAYCNTQAYQRTSRSLPENSSDRKLFSHMPVKVMTASMLLDSLAVVTGHRDAGGGGGGKAKAKKEKGEVNSGASNNPARFFDVKDLDDEPTEYSYGIPQILRLMNSNLTNKNTATVNRLAAKSGSNGQKLIEDIYVTTLGRRPSADEIRLASTYVSRAGSAKGYNGLFWVLLNSAEFVSIR